jgi:hypothetical protein
MNVRPFSIVHRAMASRSSVGGCLSGDKRFRLTSSEQIFGLAPSGAAFPRTDAPLTPAAAYQKLSTAANSSSVQGKKSRLPGISVFFLQ